MKDNKNDILVSGILKGDQKSFTIFFNRYYSGLYYYILKRTRDNELTKDIVLKTFQRAFVNIDKYNKKCAITTWLYIIGKNQLIDYNRPIKNKKNLRFDTLLNDDFEFDFKTNDYNPFELLSSKNNVKKIHDIINSIKNKKEKEAFKLSIIEGMSYSEIQKKMNISLSSVKANIFRARKFVINKLPKKLNTFID